MRSYGFDMAEHTAISLYQQGSLIKIEQDPGENTS
jgi:hypothetical protein